MGLDDKKTRQINIKFPLRKSVRGAFETNEETIDAVRDDLKLLLLTNHGERPMRYTFGCNFRDLMFEAIDGDLKQKFHDRILYSINEWMPYVNIVDINVKDSSVDASLDVNEIKIEITFDVGSTDLTGDLAITLRKQ